MKHVYKKLVGACAACLIGAPAAASTVPCGGDFRAFVQSMANAAVARGHGPDAVSAFFSGVSQDPAVLRADRRQGIFQEPFISFSRKLISQNRMDRGRQMAQRWDSVFDRVAREYGVPRGILLSFWAFETDYGAVQGDFNTANALVTLSHDCRRPELFQPQVFAAIALYEAGAFDPRRTTGAWAGEIGQVQMLPRDILQNGTDGDGDGRVTLKTSAPDALMSGGAMLSALGWRYGEPWLQEVVLPPDFDWYEAGLHVSRSAQDWARMGVAPRSGSLQGPSLNASILLPQGRFGPAFMAYPNFRVLFEWNQSFTYVLTAAYFATRLEGAPVYNAGNPEPGLQGEAMKALQRALAARGYDVGGIDGILGAGTRGAVRDVQRALGLPADAWPTPDLLSRL